MEYNDSLLRPTKVIPPSSAGQTVMEYTDTPGSVAVKTKTQIDATNWAESTVYADGLGRAIKSEKKDNGGNVFTETQYDSMGRVKKVTNPYRTGETKLWTESTYDDLSRVTKVKTPDNAEVNTAFDLATSGTLGSVVTVTDQAGKLRRSVTNALGQLARVDEPNDAGSLGTLSSPNQSTSYAYDTLNNLTTVNQGAQTRTFQYDSLSRLKQAANPESGTISYSYDANGNLTSKTDARSITTAYGYDQLNRVLTRTYSDSTPAVAYYYDGKGLSSVPNYSKGKLTKVSSSVSETKYDSFDNAGKVLTSSQATDGNAYGFAYAYNLGGMLTEETYPSGRKVRNTIATDASLSKVESQPYGGSYSTRADNFTYTAAGAVSSMQLGNGKWENAQFNSRLQPTQLGLGTSATDQSVWKVNYDYGTTNNNGNVLSQTITVPSINPLIQTYNYDSLNRLKSAEEMQNSGQTWKQTFTYDRYGNRNLDVANTTTIPSGCSQAQCNPTVDTSNNRFSSGQGYSYDNSGNVTADAQGRTFVYDAENKQKTVSDSSSTIGTYYYDDEGKRIKKISSIETTVFVYDGYAKLVAEYLLTNSTPATLTTSYLTNDTLGSPRVVTNSSGNIASRRDFMPFGEEINGWGNRTSNLGYQTDAIRQKFTGYKRDVESNLDFAQARYYGYLYGRFTSPDKSLLDQSSIDPQSWNLYSYAGNSPLKYSDPYGQWKKIDCEGGANRCWEAEEGDTYESLADAMGVSADNLREFFGNQEIVAGRVFGDSGYKEWMQQGDWSHKFFRDSQADYERHGGTPMPIGGGGLINVNKAAEGSGLFGWIGRQAGRFGRWSGLIKPKPVATAVELATKQLVGSSGREMLKDAINIIKAFKGTAAEKAELFQAFAKQIEQRTGGSWMATRQISTDGSFIWTGDAIGRVLVISPQGEIFMGNLTTDIGGFIFGKEGVMTPIYEKLTKIQ